MSKNLSLNLYFQFVFILNTQLFLTNMEQMGVHFLVPSSIFKMIDLTLFHFCFQTANQKTELHFGMMFFMSLHKCEYR